MHETIHKERALTFTFRSGPKNVFANRKARQQPSSKSMPNRGTRLSHSPPQDRSELSRTETTSLSNSCVTLKVFLVGNGQVDCNKHIASPKPTVQKSVRQGAMYSNQFRQKFWHIEASHGGFTQVGYIGYMSAEYSINCLCNQGGTHKSKQQTATSSIRFRPHYFAESNRSPQRNLQKTHQ